MKTLDTIEHWTSCQNGKKMSWARCDVWKSCLPGRTAAGHILPARQDELPAGGRRAAVFVEPWRVDNLPLWFVALMCGQSMPDFTKIVFVVSHPPTWLSFWRFWRKLKLIWCVNASYDRISLVARISIASRPSHGYWQGDFLFPVPYVILTSPNNLFSSADYPSKPLSLTHFSRSSHWSVVILDGFPPLLALKRVILEHVKFLSSTNSEQPMSSIFTNEIYVLRASISCSDISFLLVVSASLVSICWCNTWHFQIAHFDGVWVAFESLSDAPRAALPPPPLYRIGRGLPPPWSPKPGHLK